MSEYWKSTPKYWCKFCKAYVRDTKFEKQQHEATPKHQNNIQRSLRDIHRTREREQSAKQRAHDEVQRLAGVVSGSGPAAGSRPRSAFSVSNQAAFAPTPATPAERTKQVEKLAEMGVAVPEEFRRQLAMAGDWKVVAERVVDQEESKGSGVNHVAVRKRKLEGPDEGDDAETMLTGGGWGSRIKRHPGSSDPGQDIETLLAQPKREQKAESPGLDEAEVKVEEEPESTGDVPTSDTADVPQRSLKVEDVKAEDSAPAPNVVFKKRKTKINRQPIETQST